MSQMIGADLKNFSEEEKRARERKKELQSVQNQVWLDQMALKKQHKKLNFK